MPVTYSRRFVLDIGTIRYIISNKDYFNSLRDCKQKVSWGSVKSMDIKGKGNLYITFKDSKVSLILKNCLFMLELGVNLISPSQLHGLYHLISPSIALLFNKSKGLIYISHQVNSLYYIPINIIKLSKAPLYLTTPYECQKKGVTLSL